MIIDLLSTPDPCMTIAAVNPVDTQNNGVIAGTVEPRQTLMNAAGLSTFDPAEKLVLFGIDILLPPDIYWNLTPDFSLALPYYFFSYEQGLNSYPIHELGNVIFNGIKREQLSAYGLALDPRNAIADGLDITQPYTLAFEALFPSPGSTNNCFRLPLDMNTMLDAVVGVDVYNDWMEAQTRGTRPVISIGHTNPLTI